MAKDCSNCGAKRERETSSKYCRKCIPNRPLKFKSTPDNYLKEITGAKSNTIRQLDVNDERHIILRNIMIRGGYGRIGHRYNITIKNTESGEEFERYITDVSFYKGWWIISW